LLGSAVESEGDLTKHQPRPGDLSAFRRLRFALWKGSRIDVGRSFRNANQITVVGQGINLSSPDTPVY
jgi:hypothetical protein